MKTLVVYYSRTGTTKTVGESLAKMLNCDIEEIFDIKKRSGSIGYMGAARDAGSKKLTKIKDITKDPESYDCIIIGTPIWAYTMSTPIRTYLTQYHEKFKQVAFFCTHRGNPGTNFEDMEELANKKPIAIMELFHKDFKNGTDEQKIKDFIAKIKK
jgi:flavodoxin